MTDFDRAMNHSKYAFLWRVTVDKDLKQILHSQAFQTYTCVRLYPRRKLRKDDLVHKSFVRSSLDLHIAFRKHVSHITAGSDKHATRMPEKTNLIPTILRHLRVTKKRCWILLQMIRSALCLLHPFARYDPCTLSALAPVWESPANDKERWY